MWERNLRPKAAFPKVLKKRCRVNWLPEPKGKKKNLPSPVSHQHKLPMNQKRKLSNKIILGLDENTAFFFFSLFSFELRNRLSWSSGTSGAPPPPAPGGCPLGRPTTHSPSALPVSTVIFRQKAFGNNFRPSALMLFGSRKLASPAIAFYPLPARPSLRTSVRRGSLSCSRFAGLLLVPQPNLIIQEADGRFCL